MDSFALSSASITTKMPDYTVGWVYNLQDENATSDAESLIAVAIAFAVIATLAVALRLYVRLTRASKSLALDDWIALVAAVRVACFGCFKE